MPSPMPVSTEFYLSETPTERDRRIRDLFDTLDRNKSGHLDAEAIRKGFTQMTHLPARNKYVNELLDRCDTKHDGYVDFHEFKAYVCDKERELWQLFQTIDRSGDGRLRPSDLETALRIKGIEVSREEFMDFMQLMDLDGNGVIDFHEFKNFLLLLPQANMSEVYRYYQASTRLSPDAEVTIPPTDETSSHALGYLLAGGFAGACSRTCTAPFDRLKVYLITNQNSSVSLRQAITRIYQQGGWRGFFVGNGLNVMKIIPESAIKFYSYETCKRLVATTFGYDDKDSIPTTARFMAGGTAGMCAQFSIYPVETLKTRVMSLQREGKVTNSRQHSIILDTIKSMYTKGGIRAFWPGLTLGLIGVFPYQALDLGIYETLKLTYLTYMEEKTGGTNRQPSVLVLWACGMISGSIGATSVYPLNVIRTRLQAQGTPAHPVYYNSPWHAVQMTYKVGGIREFYRGLGPTLLKVVPAISISYVTYEWSKRQLDIS
ncbi:mitochondrial substrate carrier family protein [Lichtheimia corymbifera JMRC:FSU:9682]|uniref:Mitochondrial substrate carrier family protein n=1 Tax=Lichtheimia corymbifera JMRC:FSU:9682 TaxID=1263082 RepID=A0A068RVV3_9FUNG|nr:mitochondrial substrate carrier family protein [Lichtheimia corymbifera JMRC:FSU:9682]